MYEIKVFRNFYN